MAATCPSKWTGPDILEWTAGPMKRDDCTAPGNEHRDLDRALRRYDPRLSLRYNGKRRVFCVCRELEPPYPAGLHYPVMDDVGDDPDTEAVMARVRDADLRGGKSADRARRNNDLVARWKREQDAAEAEALMPNGGEYLCRLLQADSPMTQRSLARDMRRELHRAR